jgi:hypothetical protein
LSGYLFIIAPQEAKVNQFFMRFFAFYEKFVEFIRIRQNSCPKRKGWAVVADNRYACLSAFSVSLR